MSNVTVFQHKFAENGTTLDALTALRAEYPSDAYFLPFQMPAGATRMDLCLDEEIWDLCVIDVDYIPSHKHKDRHAMQIANFVREGWMYEMQDKIRDLPWRLAWYRTADGFRLLWLSPHPMTLSTWVPYLRNVYAVLNAHGIQPDAASPAKRIWRLPFVVRDGEPQRLPSNLFEIHRIPVVEFPAAAAPSATGMSQHLRACRQFPGQNLD